MRVLGTIRGVMGMAALVSASLLASAPATAHELSYGLNAHVSTRCAIADINAENWEDGVLRLETRCNAEQYRIRLLVGDQDIVLDGAESLVGDAGIQLRSGQVLVTQTRPGTRQISIRVENPFDLTGALAIRVEAV